MKKTLTSSVEYPLRSLENYFYPFKRLFNGDRSPVANRGGTQGRDATDKKVQLQSEYIVLSGGPVSCVCVCVNRVHRLIRYTSCLWSLQTD